jgi:hypothetical protein
MRAHPADLAHSGQPEPLPGHRHQQLAPDQHPSPPRIATVHASAPGTAPAGSASPARASWPRPPRRARRSPAADLKRQTPAPPSARPSPPSIRRVPGGSGTAPRWRNSTVIGRAEQPRDRAQRLRIVRTGDERRHVGAKAKRLARPDRKPRLAPGEGVPDRAVERVGHGASCRGFATAAQARAGQPRRAHRLSNRPSPAVRRAHKITRRFAARFVPLTGTCPFQRRLRFRAAFGAARSSH